MVKSISAEFYDILRERVLIERRYVWLQVKSRDTGSPAFFGFSNAPNDQTVEVRDGITGAIVNRIFRPGLLNVGSIRLVSDMTIQNLEIDLSGVDGRVENAIRGFTPRQAIVQVYYRVRSEDETVAVPTAEPIFVGFVDRTPIQTPEQGGVSTITLVCNSYGYELTKNNPDMRSNASQKDRSDSDKFYKHVQNVSDWKLWWGTRAGKLNHKKHDGKKNDKN